MTLRIALVCAAAALAALLGGCDGNKPGAGETAGPDADLGHPDAGTVEEDAGEIIPTLTYTDASVGPDAMKWDALPPPPQVVNDDGGVLATPTIIAVFFSDDDPTTLAPREAFYKGIGASMYWQAAAEYGVGAATAQIVELTEAAPATIDDTSDAEGDPTALELWLLAEISSKALPGPTVPTTYMINYPASTTVTANGTQCIDFDGYHSDVANSDMTQVYSYGVIPHCVDMGSTYLETFGGTASHELIEAATDPYPDYFPAWAQADQAHIFWDEANNGSEVADMCENDPEAMFQFSDFPYTVQRFWSDKSVLAGHDPCVPEIPGKTFFIGVPELPGKGLYDYYMSNVEVSSVDIAVGASKTIYVDLYSDGTIPDWDVTVVDFNYFYSGDPTQALLDITMPITSGNNGDRLAATITVKAAGNETTNMQIANTELFVVYSSQGTSATAPAHMWYGVVTN